MTNPLGVGWKITDLFFDRQSVASKIDPKKRRFLSKFGSFVRTRARRSIKPGGKSNKTSRPGDPPRAHVGTIKQIFFAFDKAAESVVIGPILLPTKTGGPDALEALEYGGSVMVRQVLEAQGRNRKTILGKSFRTKIDARPFMTPAFDAEKQNISSIWKSS